MAVTILASQFHITNAADGIAAADKGFAKGAAIDRRLIYPSALGAASNPPRPSWAICSTKAG
jgi:hypothetical protein